MSNKCTNPACGAEIPGDSKFCGSCGTAAPVAQANPASQTGDIGYMDGNITNTNQQGHASLGAINVHLGGQFTGQQATTQLLQCPLCGRRNDEKNIFRCRECGTDHLCLEHLDREHFVCLICVKKLVTKEQEKAQSDSDSQVVLCPLCGRRNKLLGTFQCQRCTKDHLCLEHHEASGNMCSACLQETTAEREKEETVRQKLEEEKRTPRSGHNFTEPVTGMEMIWVEGGSFDMGGWDDGARGGEKPVHPVDLTGFWIAKFPVTQGQYEKITGMNPSTFEDGEDCPVETVSWDDAQDFGVKLCNKTGIAFRLPTEAEWEYAARSRGKREKYAGSNSPDSVAWYSANSGSKTHRVGTKSPNGLGLYDMSGNVWEWCSDWYGESYYNSSPRSNPQGASSGSDRVFRGGSWGSYPRNVRAAVRSRNAPGSTDDYLGFRLVFSSGQ